MAHRGFAALAYPNDRCDRTTLQQTEPIHSASENRFVLGVDVFDDAGQSLPVVEPIVSFPA